MEITLLIVENQGIVFLKFCGNPDKVDWDIKPQINQTKLLCKLIQLILNAINFRQILKVSSGVIALVYRTHTHGPVHGLSFQN